MKSSGKYFFRISIHKLFVSQRWPEMYLILVAKLSSIRIIQIVLVWRGLQECLRLGTVRSGVPEESLKEAISESANQLQKKTPAFGSTTMRWAPRKAAGMEWKKSEPGRQSLCAEEDRTKEVTQALGGAQKTMSGSQTLSNRLFTTLWVWFYIV